LCDSPHFQLQYFFGDFIFLFFPALNRAIFLGKDSFFLAERINTLLYFIVSCNCHLMILFFNLDSYVPPSQLVRSKCGCSCTIEAIQHQLTRLREQRD